MGVADVRYVAPDSNLTKNFAVYLDEKSMNPCAICLHDISDSQVARKIRACGHHFHANCLSSWKTAGGDTCPLCRVRFKNVMFKEELDDRDIVMRACIGITFVMLMVLGLSLLI